MKHHTPTKLPDFPKRIYFVTREVYANWIETLPPKTPRNRSSESLGYYKYEDNGVLKGVVTGYPIWQIEEMNRKKQIVCYTN